MIIIINQTKIIITGEITKNNNHRGHLYLLGQTRSFPRSGPKWDHSESGILGLLHGPPCLFEVVPLSPNPYFLYDRKILAYYISVIPGIEPGSRGLNRFVLDIRGSWQDYRCGRETSIKCDTSILMRVMHLHTAACTPVYSWFRFIGQFGSKEIFFCFSKIVKPEMHRWKPTMMTSPTGAKKWIP